MPSHNKKRGQGQAGRNAPPAPAPDPQPSTYDGPPESPGRGRAGSTTGASGRASSRARSQPRVDPARDPPPAPVLVRNVDFGGQAYDYNSTVSVISVVCVEGSEHQSFPSHRHHLHFPSIARPAA